LAQLLAILQINGNREMAGLLWGKPSW
jgi:hypothetical protein